MRRKIWFYIDNTDLRLVNSSTLYSKKHIFFNNQKLLDDEILLFINYLNSLEKGIFIHTPIVGFEKIENGFYSIETNNLDAALMFKLTFV